MNMDPGLIVVIAAVLLFYLRLILLQRARAKQAAAARLSNAVRQAPSKRKPKGSPPVATPPRYSILSHNRRDLIIGGTGFLVLLVGVLLNAGLFTLPAIQAYWWLPTALGIVAFSWAFAL